MSVNSENLIKKIQLNPSQIIVSSYFESHIPSILNFEQGDYWQPLTSENNPFIQFNFNNLFDVTAIEIQNINIPKIHYEASSIESIKVFYMTLNNKWVEHFETLNYTPDSSLIERLTFDQPINCVKLKLYPLNFKSHCALKFNLFAIEYLKYNIYDNLVMYTNLNLCSNTMMDYKLVSEYAVQSNIQKRTSLIGDKIITNNILNEQIQDGVCLFTCVMNRNSNIVNNINTWLKQSINQLIIIDWASDDDFCNFINTLNDNRVLHVRVNDEQYFIRTYAQNLAAQLCRFNKICKIDSDIVLHDNFFEQHNLEENTFFVGEWRAARNENEKHVNGTIYLYRNDFLYVNGYNEFIKSYGWEDSDFTIRLMLTGLEKKIFNFNTLYHVPHAAIERTINMTSATHPEVQTLTHKYLLAQMQLWSRNNILTSFNFNQISSNYIVCNRIKTNEISFDSILYDTCKKEAELTVFSWYMLKTDEHKNVLQEKNYNFIVKYLNDLVNKS